MESTPILVFVMEDSLEIVVKLKSMNAFPIHALTREPVRYVIRGTSPIPPPPPPVSYYYIYISQDAIDDFICNCTQEYVGKTCETPAHICSVDPCQSGGTCQVGIYCSLNLVSLYIFLFVPLPPQSPSPCLPCR